MTRSRTESFAVRYGKWVIVAGASESLGAAFAACLAERGLHLLLIARRAELLGRVAGRLREQHGVETRCLALDLADPRLSEVITEATADLDVGLLVYNAA